MHFFDYGMARNDSVPKKGTQHHSTDKNINKKKVFSPCKDFWNTAREQNRVLKPSLKICFKWTKKVRNSSIYKLSHDTFSLNTQARERCKNKSELKVQVQYKVPFFFTTAAEVDFAFAWRGCGVRAKSRGCGGRAMSRGCVGGRRPGCWRPGTGWSSLPLHQEQR
jgi:hypothetical protein